MREHCTSLSPPLDTETHTKTPENKKETDDEFATRGHVYDACNTVLVSLDQTSRGANCPTGCHTSSALQSAISRRHPSLLRLSYSTTRARQIRSLSLITPTGVTFSIFALETEGRPDTFPSHRRGRRARRTTDVTGERAQRAQPRGEIYVGY